MLAFDQRLSPWRRLGSGAFIVAVHAAVAALALAGAGVRPPTSAPPPVQVRLIEPTVAIAPPPPPLAAPRLVPVPLPTVPLPEVPAVELPRESVVASTASQAAEDSQQGSAPQPAAHATVAPAPPARGEAPVEVEHVAYLHFDPPPYPALSRRLGEQGVVLLRVLIDEQGVPLSVQVHRSSGYARLDAAAAEALRRARFRPYREGDRTRSAVALVPVRFELS